MFSPVRSILHAIEPELRIYNITFLSDSITIHIVFYTFFWLALYSHWWLALLSLHLSLISRLLIAWCSSDIVGDTIASTVPFRIWSFSAHWTRQNKSLTTASESLQSANNFQFFSEQDTTWYASCNFTWVGVTPHDNFRISFWILKICHKKYKIRFWRLARIDPGSRSWNMPKCRIKLLWNEWTISRMLELNYAIST